MYIQGIYFFYYKTFIKMRKSMNQWYLNASCEVQMYYPTSSVDWNFTFHSLEPNFAKVLVVCIQCIVLNILWFLFYIFVFWNSTWLALAMLQKNFKTDIGQVLRVVINILNIMKFIIYNHILSSPLNLKPRVFKIVFIETSIKY